MKIKKKVTISRIFAHFARQYTFPHMPDKWYLSMVYKGETGRKLNWDNPKRYTEKVQWMKIHDRNPRYTEMVDKAAAKKWAGAIIGEEHIIPQLGIWDSVEEIDFESLPNQFVLKGTHDSHSIVICKDKRTFDYEAAKVRLNRSLQTEHFYLGRQWPYKNVKPRIIAEKYMENESTGDLRDYKFFTFNGEPKVMYIATGRGTGETYGDFFDMNFNHLELCIDHRTAPVCPEKPACFEEMKQAATLLARGTPQVRVDFYEVNGQYYFGEMTFFHCGGFVTFQPDSWDETFGSWMPDMG